MATTSQQMKSKSAQQWAWEFLRRNPEYRDAFNSLKALSPDQAAQFERYLLEDGEHEIDVELMCPFDLKFFDTSDMTGYKDGQKTVGDYIVQSQKVREVLDEIDIYLPLASKFKLKTYSLAKWWDPNAELTSADVASMWTHETLVDFGLYRYPAADGFKTMDEHSEETGWYGWPPRSSDGPSLKKTDKRLRKSPVNGGNVYRGSDGRSFTPLFGILRFEVNITQARVLFDLSLPIEFQLKRVKESLKKHQEDLTRSGFVQSLPKQADKFGMFSEYLEILDMLDGGQSQLDIAKKIDGVTTTPLWQHDAKANKLVQVQRVVGRSKRGAPVNELTQAVRKKIERAISLRDHGYRALAFTA